MQSEALSVVTCGSCRRAREAKHPCKECENGSASDVFQAALPEAINNDPWLIARPTLTLPPRPNAPVGAASSFHGVMAALRTPPAQ